MKQPSFTISNTAAGVAFPSVNISRHHGRDVLHPKGKSDWFFGMKAHVGVDAGSGLIHCLVTTTAKEQEVTQGRLLLREVDYVVYGDNGYDGIESALRYKATKRKAGLITASIAAKGKFIAVVRQ